MNTKNSCNMKKYGIKFEIVYSFAKLFGYNSVADLYANYDRFKVAEIINFCIQSKIFKLVKNDIKLIDNSANQNNIIARFNIGKDKIKFKKK